MSSAPLTRLRWLACLVVLYWAPAALHAAITATVEPSTVTVDESFHLILESDGVVDGDPDLSTVKRDFEVVNQSRGQNVSIVDGRVSRRTSWEIELLPLRSGAFTIPAIEIGSKTSNSVDVVVRPSPPSGREGSSHVFLEVEVDERTPYVQQQIIYTVRVFRSGNTESSRLSEPVPEGVDTLVERLGFYKASSLSVRGGRRYQVMERRHAFFPQAAGRMVIPPVQFQTKVIEQAGLRSGLLGSVRKRSIRVRSEAVTVTVREPPAGAPAPWKPARALSLSESWAATDSLSVGDTLTRRIVIRAEGLTAAQLPEIDQVLPEGMKQYPEQPELSNVAEGGGITGTRAQTTAFVATRPGTFTLPAVTLSWWNVETRRVEQETLPPRTIEVAASAAVAPVTPLQTVETGGRQAGPEPAGRTPWYWPWISAVLALAWLLTLWRWWADRRRHRRPHEPPSGRVAPDRDEALAALQRACNTHDPRAARDALLAWSAAMWPQAPPVNLTQIGRRCGDAVSHAVDDLERTLYAPGQTAGWDGTSLWACLNGVDRSEPAAPAARPPGLEPLYLTRDDGRGPV